MKNPTKPISAIITLIAMIFVGVLIFRVFTKKKIVVPPVVKDPSSVTNCSDYVNFNKCHQQENPKLDKGA